MSDIASGGGVQKRTALGVAAHGSQLLVLSGVPQLHISLVGADSEIVAIGSPRDGGDEVISTRALHELVDGARSSIPEVDALAESDGELVACAGDRVSNLSGVGCARGEIVPALQSRRLR